MSSESRFIAHPSSYKENVSFVKSEGKWFGRNPNPKKTRFGHFFEWRPFATKNEAEHFAEQKKEVIQLTIQFQ